MNNSLQIPFVVDGHSGDTIRSGDLSTLFELHEIEEIRVGKEVGRFLCPVCNDVVNLHACKDDLSGHGHRYHFQHRSGAICPWKSDSQSKAAIYQGVQEGSRHLDMKHLLNETLKQLDGWEVVDVDKRFIFNQDRTIRGKPDLHARYQGQDVVFEIQLRSENPETIRRRKALYRDKQWWLVWISADGAELVSEQFSDTCIKTRQVHKDMAFSNRGNWFIFNEDIATRSIEEGCLYILVRYWSARLDQRHIEYEWEESVTSLTELTYQDGDLFYQDFYCHLHEAQNKLRHTGQRDALVALEKQKFSNWDQCIRHIKAHVWPSMDVTGEDGTWLHEKFRSIFNQLELKRKQWLVHFFADKNYRWQRWQKLADQPNATKYGIFPDQDYDILEKLLLILGHKLRDHLGPEQKQYIRSCHYFFDYESHFPYRALCERAIEASPYRGQINEAPSILKRAQARSFHPEETNLDQLFNWFISHPVLPPQP